MRIPIEKIGTLSIQAKKQTLQVQCPLKDLKTREILDAKYCSLRIDGRKIDCKVVSLNGKKTNTHILMEMDRNKGLTIILEALVHTETKCSLLVSERVDFGLYNEVKKLLEEESLRSGKSPEAILLDITRYKDGVEGCDALVFISNKQLAVLKDNLLGAVAAVA
ncbi:MAG: hypothetical protein ACLQF0_05395 [Dissulfurispiraceae bacterium]